MDKKFEDIKIKMVMKLRGVSRDKAVALISENTSPLEKSEGEGEIAHVAAAEFFGSDEDDLLSAKDLFGEDLA